MSDTRPSIDGGLANKQDTAHDIDRLPICVDLDGSLAKIDTLQEAAFAGLIADWTLIFRIPALLARGKAALKQHLAQRWDFDPAHLPYNAELLDYLRKAKASGRRIVLATAADRLIAERVANHLGIFDEVIASDGVRNLRGAHKAEALCERFGEGGFVYVGNDRTDHAIWRRAAAAVIVKPAASLRHKAEAEYKVAAVFESYVSKWRACLKAIRPYQWTKNFLVFVPVVASGRYTDVAAWSAAGLTFTAFCCVASSIYLVNDISDLAADRAHPRKSKRPIASGNLSVAEALLLALPLLAGGICVGWFGGALAALLLYAALSVSYNFKIKELPLIDVFVLASLYTVRLFAGGEATEIGVSLWLLGFSSFLFLSLALIKRVSELKRLQAANKLVAERRGYMVEDLVMLQIMGCGSSFASAVVLSLYVQSDTASKLYAFPAALWGIIPLLLFWQCRLWLSTARGYMHDDPIVYAARDWVSWTVALVFVGLIVAARIGVQT